MFSKNGLQMQNSFGEFRQKPFWLYIMYGSPDHEHINLSSTAYIILKSNNISKGV